MALSACKLHVWLALSTCKKWLALSNGKLWLGLSTCKSWFKKKNVFNKNCLSPEQQDMTGIFFCDCSETPIPIQIPTLFHVIKKTILFYSSA